MPRKSRAKPKEDDDVDTPKSKRTPNIQLAKNPEWTYTPLHTLEVKFTSTI